MMTPFPVSTFIEKSAKEFRKSIINDNGLTREDTHLSFDVKNLKI